MKDSIIICIDYFLKSRYKKSIYIYIKNMPMIDFFYLYMLQAIGF